MSGERPNWQESSADDLKAIVGVESYSGRSETIKGFQRIGEAIGQTPGIKSIEPAILLKEAYLEYKNNGISAGLKKIAKAIWDHLDGDRNPLIVRRLFPNESGIRADGPRSGNITDCDDLLHEIAKFYDYFDINHIGQGIIPEIMVHRVVDAGNPPKQESPFLPFPGGDVVPLSPTRFQVRAIFGADESVQNCPADKWLVEMLSDGSCKVNVAIRAKKIHAKVPAFPEYREIEIPAEFQEELALMPSQVVSLAEVCQRMNKLHGPHRLEFDGTRAGSEEPLVIIETAPHNAIPIPEEILTEFEKGKIKPAHVFSDENDNLNFIASDNSPILVFIPNTYIGRDEISQSRLKQLAGIAKEREKTLLVLAATDISTQHLVLILTNAGHTAICVGNEVELEDSQEVLVYRKSHELLWERHNPIVTSGELNGRGIENVGGKAVGLEKLRAAGFKVPPYFMIETSLFRRLIKELGIGEEISNLDSMGPDELTERNDIVKSFQKKIWDYQGDLIEQLTPDLEQALFQIGGSHFFVRSSATCEDAIDNAFAGAFDTVPNIGEQEIPKAILKVFSSIFDSGTISILKGAGIKPSDVLMGIIIQTAVDSQKSGTMFTKDILGNRENSLILEAGLGQGEEIVAGSAKIIRHILIDKTTREIQEDRGGGILDPEEISALVNLGMDVEKRLKVGPQDIEWAIDKNGEIFLIQARPLR